MGKETLQSQSYCIDTDTCSGLAWFYSSTCITDSQKAQKHGYHELTEPNDCTKCTFLSVKFSNGGTLLHNSLHILMQKYTHEKLR